MKKFAFLILFVTAFTTGFTQYNYLGNYTADGTPLYFAPNDVVNSQTLNLVAGILPESKPVPIFNPHYISSGYDSDIILDDSAEVWVTFVDEGAGYKNVLGFYTYDIRYPLTSVPPSNKITIIFPNVSKAGSGGSLQPGNKVKLGSFPANTGIGFILIADGWRNGAVGNGNWKLYSNPSFNPEANPSLRYHNVLISDSTNNRVILGFEDIRRDNSSCDNDFNDALFYITASPYTAIRTENFVTVESSNTNVFSGNEGGLESNGDLAEKIAKRFFERDKNNLNKYAQKNFQKSYFDTYLRYPTLYDNSLKLHTYLPSTGMYGTETAFISTPTDLVNITNATDVFSNDYYLNNNRVAAALITRTAQKVYDHSKMICDRLNGASLEDIRTVELRGHKLINTIFTYAGGEKEYTLTFSVKLDSNDNKLYSCWNIDQYPSGDYLNFQVWGQSMGQVCGIAYSILGKLESEKTLISFPELTKLPDVFIKSGYYNNGALYLQVSNRKKIGEITLTGNGRINEKAAFRSYKGKIKLSGKTTEDIVYNSGKLFDIGIAIAHAGNTQLDALYLADGAWGIDYNVKLAELTQFNVSSNTPNFASNVLGIERNPTVKGRVKGIINLFRNAKAGNKPLDISGYNYFSFEIQCSHVVEVVLVDTSLTSWENRARFSITATPQKRTITIPLKSFKNGTGAEATLKSLKTMVFSVMGNDTQFANFSLQVKNVQFTNSKPIESGYTTEPMAYPNPFTRYTTLSFPNDPKAGYLVITDLSGKQVANKQIQIHNGEYSYHAAGLKKGMYFFTLIEATGNKQTGRFIIQ